MRALLDVNALLALFDADHVFHAPALEWVDRNASHGWASCAITQNGFVRVISQPRYPNPVSATSAVRQLTESAEHTDHEFWTCQVSLSDSTIDISRLLSSSQLTDAYLLALAVRSGGRLVTFDRRIGLSAVRGAEERHLIVL